MTGVFAGSASLPGAISRAVFNELLTGKATLDPPPQPQSPYREPGVVPPVTHTCPTCRQAYRARAGSIAGTCGSCQEIQARNDALAFQQAEAAQQRVQNQHKLFVFIGSIVIVALAVVFKVGMKTQLREDLAQGAGYQSYSDYQKQRDTVAPSDEYSRRVHALASDMCACKDLACARNVQTTFVSYSRSHRPSDDNSEASASADVAKLADCQHAIESASP
jgi:cell division septation protein DedD